MHPREPARRVIVIVHGVHTSRKDADRWMTPAAKLLRGRTGSDVVEFRYGWASAAMTRIPFFGWWARRRKTRKFQNLVRRLRRRDPDIAVAVVAHSFGTWITYYSTCRGKAKRRTQLGRVVLMASIVPKRSRFNVAAFERVLNMYSRNDGVVRLASYAGFGSSGVEGFVLADGRRLRNVDVSPYDHDCYVRPQARSWDLAAVFLR